MHFFKRCLFSVTLFLLLLVAADVIVGRLHPPDALKIQLLSDGDEGHCYSSDPQNAFPLDLESARDRQTLARVVRHYRPTSSSYEEPRLLDIEYLRRAAPHCVLYDAERRRAGFFPRRRRQVAIVGDSFTFGEGVANEQTLGYLLGRAFPEINFRNLGVPGINAPLVQDRVRDHLGAWPAVPTVIYFYNLNDALVPDGVDHNSYCVIGDFLCEALSDPDQGSSRLLELSSILSLLQRQRRLQERTQRVLWGFQEAYFGKRNKPYLRDTLAVLSSMHRELKSHGGRLHVVIYPVLFRAAEGEYPFLRIHGLLMEACKRRGLSCLDGYRAFAGPATWSTYRVHPADSHPNGRANWRLVQYLSSRLKL